MKTEIIEAIKYLHWWEWLLIVFILLIIYAVIIRLISHSGADP